MYGLSETCGPSTINNHMGFKLGSIGRVFLGCKLKIRDPDENGNGEVRTVNDEKQSSNIRSANLDIQQFYVYCCLTIRIA